MGKSEMEKEKLNQTLTEHMSNIHETLQIMDLTPSSSLQKVSWEEVLKIGDQLSKNATSGILFQHFNFTIIFVFVYCSHVKS